MVLEWECLNCGYLYEGRAAPSRCPDCDAVGAWEKVEYIDEDSEDEDEDDE